MLVTILNIFFKTKFFRNLIRRAISIVILRSALPFLGTLPRLEHIVIRVLVTIRELFLRLVLLVSVYLIRDHLIQVPAHQIFKYLPLIFEFLRLCGNPSHMVLLKALNEVNPF